MESEKVDQDYQWDKLVSLCEGLLLDADGLLRCSMKSQRYMVLQLRIKCRSTEIDGLATVHHRAYAVREAQEGIFNRR